MAIFNGADLEASFSSRSWRSIPLSPNQEQLRFTESVLGPSPGSNIGVRIAFNGVLDEARLFSAVDRVLQKYETLRSRFPEGEDQGTGEIADGAYYEKRQLEAQGPDLASRRQWAENWVGQATTRLFDMTTGPLVRITLIKLDPEAYIFHFCAHHLVMDGWSAGLLIKDLRRYYVQQDLQEVEDAARSYRAYAEEEKQRVAQGYYDPMLAYWRSYLEGAPALHGLPLDRERVKVKRGNYRVLSFHFGEEVAKPVKQLSGRSGCSRFIILESIFALLVCRLSGTRDVLIASPTHNRQAAWRKSIVGFMSNAVALRTHIEGNPAGSAFLALQRASKEEALARMETPFHLVVDAVNPVRATNHAPLCQLMFHLHPKTRGFRLDQVEAEPEICNGINSYYDLTLTLEPSGHGYLGRLEYDADLWDHAWAERFLARYRQLVLAVAAQPEAPVMSLTLTTPGEARQLAAFLCGPQTPAPVDFLSEYAKVAAQYPSREALKMGTQRWTYGALDRLSSFAAAQLEARGVRRGRVVALMAVRRPSTLGMILAVLKTGAAYLPLDPSLPSARIMTMLERSQADWLLLDKGGVAPARFRGGVVDMDQLWQAAETQPLTPYAIQPVCLTDPAYVLFTSGSTGTPKGVVMNRGALSNLLSWQRSAYGGGFRTLQFAALSFDVSFQEIFSTWTGGGSLVIAPDSARGDSDALLQLLSEDGIEHLYLPFVALNHLAQTALESGQDQVLPRLKRVISAGEALRITPAIAAWFQKQPGCRLHNHYGPTETHVVTAFDLPETQPWPELPSIGTPIANVALRVLDSDGNPCPFGVKGELFIAGTALANGYLGQQSLTAERFQIDAFSAVPGGRMYRTGDVVSVDDRGLLHFHGRSDRQVKIRGFRVELDEIEACLCRHALIREAAVHVIAHPELGAVPVAFVPSHPQLDEQGLRAFLAEALPSYMVPAHIEFMPSLPHTRSGKVDREKLRSFRLRHTPAHQAQGPRNAVEQSMVHIWETVFARSPISVHDQFFALGGHSLLAGTILTKIRKTHGVRVSLKDFFAAPTPAELAQLVADQMGGNIGVEGMKPGLTTAQGLHPLSPAQRRIWLLDQLDPGGSAYNVFSVIRIEGVLDEPAFCRALDDMVARHESLRTRFTVQGGQAFQEVQSFAGGSCVTEDLSPGTGHPDLLDRHLHEEGRRGFDLTGGPLFRFRLFRLGPLAHVFSLCIHHIAVDGVSIGIFLRELASAYRARLAGQAAPLPPPTFHYRDYAAWCDAQPADQLAPGMAYWQALLAPPLPVLALRPDFKRPNHTVYQAGYVFSPLDPSLMAAVTDCARCLKTTVFTVMLAAYKLLLCRFSGKEEQIVGVPSANRVLPECEDLVGFFVNTLALRTRYSAKETGAQWVQRISQSLVAAQMHQDVPFDLIVDLVAGDRSPDRLPLCQTFFSSGHWDVFDLGDQVSLSPIPVGIGAAKFELSLMHTWLGDSSMLTWEYAAQLFKQETIERMADHYQKILRSLVLDPQRPVWTATLLPQDEADLVLQRWGRNQLDVAPVNVGSLIARQAAAQPESIAVIHEEENGQIQHLSYRELAQGVERFAAILQAEGVGPEKIVGLFFDRVPFRYLAILATWKAGAAFLPLDMAYPEERLAWMVADAAPHLVVVEDRETAAQAARLFPGKRILNVQDALARTAVPRLRQPAYHPDHHAYLIYTSGSTGRPKGVAVTHRGLASFVRSMQQLLQMRPGHRFGQFAPFSFDAFVSEFLPTFVSGACLVTGASALMQPGEPLTAFLDRHRITHQFLTPSALQLMPNVLPDALATLFVGGEACSRNLVRRYAGNVNLVNIYGPTEVTVGVCAHPFTSVEEEVTIGTPMLNCQVLILDPLHNPVPIGVAGELYLSGPGLARGYLARPALTADRFLPNPYGAPGSRMYRSGDEARFLDNGNIEFLGRLDDQVKVRGFRIELGEIEVTLAAYPGVREAAAALRSGPSGDAMLVGYVVLDGPPIEQEDLIRFMRAKLPHYMVPVHVVAMQALPQTPNGKCDRQRLPGISRHFRPEGPPPHTALEKEVARAWSEVLGIEGLGVNDNFFKLGGHSLKGAQVVARLSGVLGVTVPLRALFSHATIGALAAHLEGLPGKGSRFARLEKTEHGGRIPAIPSQQRIWSRCREAGFASGYNIPLAARLKGAVHSGALASALDTLLQKHEALRTGFVAEGEGRLFQVIAPHVRFQLVIEDLRQEADPLEKARARAAADGETGFDLETAPLLRASLLQLQDDEFVFLLNVHHIVADGWSVAILLKELAEFYGRFAAGQTPLESAPAFTFSDYSRWLLQALASPRKQQEARYWQNQLADCPTLLRLPLDRPYPTVPDWRGDHHVHTLSVPLSRKVDALAQDLAVTPFMLFQLGLAMTFRHFGSDDDLLIATPIGNRPFPEVEQMVGLFLNALVLRHRLSDSRDFVQMVHQTRAMVLDAFAHQLIPLPEVIAERLQGDFPTAYHPLYQVMFALQNAPLAQAQLPGLQTQPLGSIKIACKYDLSLNMVNNEGLYCCTWEYKTALFNATTIQAMAGHFHRVLQQVVADPSLSLREINQRARG